MPVLVGHRGAPMLVLENTVPSLLRAQALGADAVEFDVRGTRDGVPVLLHDRTLQRFWGRPEQIGELELLEVRGLRCQADAEARVPTLAEVVAAVSPRLVVDGKDPNLVPTIIEVLRAHGGLDRASFIGEPAVLVAVRRELPDADIIMSWSGDQPPSRELLDRVRPQAVNLPWDALSDDTYDAMRGLGCRVWTYCVDDVTAARRASALGIEGVITNDLPTVSGVLGGAVRTG